MKKKEKKKEEEERNDESCDNLCDKHVKTRSKTVEWIQLCDKRARKWKKERENHKRSRKVKLTTV